MKFNAMFQPIQIGSVTIPNRFAVPPMGNNFANTDGTLSDRSAAYYAARAKGGFGLITIESTVVYSEAKGGPRKPCLFSDDTVDSFRKVADAIHANGAIASIQLQHAGPEGNSALTGFPLKAASAIAPSSGREVPVAISREEIYKLIECYGDAAAALSVPVSIWSKYTVHTATWSALSFRPVPITVSMNSAAAVYGADRSWYLVNGSTCGILAAIAAAVKRGKKSSWLEIPTNRRITRWF